MTAFIVSENNYEIKIIGKSLTEIISEKLTSEKINISYDDNFSNAVSLPIIIYPSNIFTDENLAELAKKISPDEMIFLTKDKTHGIKMLGSIPKNNDLSKFKVKIITPAKDFFIINSRESFLLTQKHLLSGKNQIGKSTVIGKNVYISENSYVGKNVYIGENTKIIDSCVEDNAYISDNVTVKESIVCEKANIGCGETKFKKIISKNIFPPKKKIFETDGKLHNINANEAFNMGKNVSGKIILCAYSENAKDIFEAFCLSAYEASNIINFGNISENILRFAIQENKCDFGLYFSEEYVRAWSGDSLYASENLKKSLESGIQRFCEYSPLSYKPLFIPYRSISEYYRESLNEIYSVKESKVFADIYCKDYLKMICAEFAEKNKLTDRNNPRISFSINSDGMRVCAYSDETGFIPHEKLIMLCMTREKSGFVSLPMDFPETADRIKKVRRMDINPDYEKMTETEIKRDLSARKNANPLYFDAIKIIARILRILYDEDINFYELAKSIPEYSYSGRIIPIHEKSEKIFKKLGLSERGGNVKTSYGKARLFPLRTGEIFLAAESMSLEISAEICDEAIEILNHIDVSNFGNN